MSGSNKPAVLGAAFLMATSAIGPGFLNNTSLFTKELLANFGFVILVSILIDIGAQLNIWRIVTASNMRAQDLSNKMLPGLGHFLAFLVAFGGLAFNIGNVAGCGLGLEVLTGLAPRWGALISGAIALVIFWARHAGRVMDMFVKVAGIVMIGLTLYVMFVSSPPYYTAVAHTFRPRETDLKMIVALVGGTVGGYISFAGAHRLLDAGISGRHSMREVNKSAISGIVVTSMMRYILFLAALGVVWHGAVLDVKNPAASVFQTAAGMVGYKFFGLVMWAAAITSVIGASYTSVSFLKTLHPSFASAERWLTSGFIIVSTVFFMVLKQAPSYILVTAGALNGLILPVALSMMLVAAAQKRFFDGYRHPRFLQLVGWAVVAIMGWMGGLVITEALQ